MLTDTHAHLYWDSFKEDLDQVIQRSQDAKVNTIINVGTDVETSKLALEQCLSKFDIVKGFSSFSSIGIHPHEAIKYFTNTDVSIHKDIDRLEEIYQTNSNKVVAVGECGLDYMFEGNPDWIPSSISLEQVKVLQKKLLQVQVDLAKKLGLPLLIHCRTQNAWDEIWELITDHYGILHCYSGSKVDTKKALDSKFLISFPATITYPKNEYLRQIAKELPLEKIVLETDCPFLPPQGKRGQRNEPLTITEIAELIASLRGITVEQVASQTTHNVKQLFKLS